MSQENVEIVRRNAEAYIRGDFDHAFEGFDPEVEWEETPGLGPDAGVYRGVDAAKGALESWRAMWVDYEAEIDEYIDAGEEVVVLGRERGRGRSGVEVAREVAHVETFSDGRVVRVRVFACWREALEAAGVSR